MSEMNATPATEAATSETQDFLSSVGESEKRVRVSGKAVSDEVVLSTKDVNVYYGDHHALHDASLDFHKGEITALIGPSGCGKSTFLRSLNLMNREIRGCRVEGEINYRGRNVNIKAENTYELRRSIGMVFQQPNPFRKSIRDNITFAPRRHGITDRDELDRMVEESLRGAALWDEVKDKLDKSAYALSGGQQQRLCIARTLRSTRRDSVRRALLGARPHLDAGDRGPHVIDCCRPRHRHRDAQHGAGVARVQPHGVLLHGRYGRVRRDRRDFPTAQG